MHRDVDDAEAGPNAFDRMDVLDDSTRDLNPSRGNTRDDDPREIVISLDNLVRDSPDGLADRLRIHHEKRLLLVCHLLSRPLWVALKGQESYVAFAWCFERSSRQAERYFTIQSRRARSNPMS